MCVVLRRPKLAQTRSMHAQNGDPSNIHPLNSDVSENGSLMILGKKVIFVPIRTIRLPREEGSSGDPKTFRCHGNLTQLEASSLV